MPDRSRAPTILGLVVVGVGLVPIAGAVFADDSGFHAPRWIVALVGSGHVADPAGIEFRF